MRYIIAFGAELTSVLDLRFYEKLDKMGR